MAKSGMPFYCLIFMVAVLSSTCGTEYNPPWRIYRGAWFEIHYPSEFKPVPIEKSITSKKGFDGVSFQSPGGKVSFYVFSPQWGGSPTETKAKQTEIVESTKTTQSKNPRHAEETITEKWISFRAKDGTYRRYIYIRQNEIASQSSVLVFGIQAKSERDLENYKSDYEKFKKSLVQYAD